MNFQQKKQGIGLFNNYLNAEIVLQELKDTGFPQQQISFVAQMEELHDDLTTVYHTHNPGNPMVEEAKARVASGGIFGSLVDLLDNIKTLKISLLGKEHSLIAGGSLANEIRNHAEHTEFCLTNVLLNLGTPQARAEFYSDRVSQGDCLIMVDGSTDDIAQAAKVLKHQGVQEWEIYEVQEQGTSEPSSLKV